MTKGKPTKQSLPLPAVPQLQIGEPDRIIVPVSVENWDEYFLYIAAVASIKSKDPKCSVGAVIVSRDKVVLSTGFNGLPRGVYDDEQTLADAEEKLKVVCHAEHNAILNAARVGSCPLDGATIYVTKFPCLGCCIAIIQAGINRIYTHDETFWQDDPADKDHKRKLRLLHEAHITVDAHYHPAFNPEKPIRVPKKKPPARETATLADVKLSAGGR